MSVLLASFDFDQTLLYCLMRWLAMHVVLLHCREWFVASAFVPCLSHACCTATLQRMVCSISFCALSQDEEGKILLQFPEPMKGFRDFLYFDEQLQMSIGNRGSLTIIQQEA